MSELFDSPCPAIPILAQAAECTEEQARAGILALVRAGYVIAPREPTNGMIFAYLETYTQPTQPESVIQGAAKARRRWKAMAESGCRMALSAKHIDQSARDYARHIATEVRNGKPPIVNGGKRKGGLARAAKLSPERRSEIARNAASVRWSAPS